METILLTALYTELPGHQASLVLRGHNAPELTLTTIHESIIDGTYTQDISGDQNSCAFTVQDNESVTVLARCNGDIVACAVFQVATGYIEAGYVLRPVSLCHTLVEQCDAALWDRAKARALASLNSDSLLADVDRILAEVER